MFSSIVQYVGLVQILVSLFINLAGRTDRNLEFHATIRFNSYVSLEYKPRADS